MSPKRGKRPTPQGATVPDAWGRLAIWLAADKHPQSTCAYPTGGCEQHLETAPPGGQGLEYGGIPRLRGVGQPEPLQLDLAGLVDRHHHGAWRGRSRGSSWPARRGRRCAPASGGRARPRRLGSAGPAGGAVVVRSGATRGWPGRRPRRRHPARWRTARGRDAAPRRRTLARPRERTDGRCDARHSRAKGNPGVSDLGVQPESRCKGKPVARRGRKAPELVGRETRRRVSRAAT